MNCVRAGRGVHKDGRELPTLVPSSLRSNNSEHCFTERMHQSIADRCKRTAEFAVKEGRIRKGGYSWGKVGGDGRRVMRIARWWMTRDASEWQDNNDKRGTQEPAQVRAVVRG